MHTLIQRPDLQNKSEIVQETKLCLAHLESEKSYVTANANSSKNTVLALHLRLNFFVQCLWPSCLGYISRIRVSSQATKKIQPALTKAKESKKLNATCESAGCDDITPSQELHFPACKKYTFQCHYGRMKYCARRNVKGTVSHCKDPDEHVWKEDTRTCTAHGQKFRVTSLKLWNGICRQLVLRIKACKTA